MKEDETNDSSVNKGDIIAEEDLKTAVQDSDTSPSDSNESDTATTLPIHKTKRINWVFVGIVLFLIVDGVIFWLFKDQIVGVFVKQPVAQIQTVVPSESPESSAIEKQKASDPVLAMFITPATGETWLATPKDMTPQGWLMAEELSYYQEVGVGTSYYKSAQDQRAEAMPTYKEVGMRAGNTIVLVHSPLEGPGGAHYVFEKHADGKVAIIIQPAAAGFLDGDGVARAKESVAAKVTVIDTTTHYDSLNVPEKLALENGENLLRPENFFIADRFGVASGEGVTRTVVSQLGGSVLYKTEVKYADTHLTNIGYYVQLPMGTKVSMRYEPNQSSLEGYSFDNGVDLRYKGGEGKMYYDTVGAIARGCGGNSAAVTRSDALKETDVVQVGKTNTGAAVYEIKDKAAALYKKAYDEYKQMYEAQAVSFDTYVKNHGLVIMKNAQGELLVYVRAQYAIGGGCAKPVVYLYPTSTTLVNVRVGADVTVSDPYYPSDGWKNVLAAPNGQLNYQGKAYDSLFWEGQGFGGYPGIVSGTVVRRADAAATMRHQLSQQGLNAKETADFMAFWETKIPNKPYIRLTWLSTAQMNTLAPLQISPKPTTVIRVFLDMDGFDAPISLPAQKLSAVERKGFTVVEWGGLTSEIRH